MVHYSAVACRSKNRQSLRDEGCPQCVSQLGVIIIIDFLLKPFNIKESRAVASRKMLSYWPQFIC